MSAHRDPDLKPSFLDPASARVVPLDSLEGDVPETLIYGYVRDGVFFAASQWRLPTKMAGRITS